MDIGNLKENTKYYEGFEDEEEMIFTIEGENNIDLHIWRGYFDSLFDNYDYKEQNKKGFTKDYHLCEGVYNMKEKNRIDKVDEYLNDLLTYKNIKFTYPEAEKCLQLIIELFEYAKQNNKRVLIEGMGK